MESIMADLTPEEAANLGYTPQTAGLPQAVRDDPWSVLMAMFTGKDTAGSSGAGNLFASQGSTLNPTRTNAEAAALANSYQLAPDVRNAPEMDAIFRAGANAPGRANPYSTQIADQSRAGQLALMNQMRGQMNGPSIAAMQGQRAMSQMGQQALMQGGRAGMLGAQAGAGGLAGDVGQARLAEVMRAQAGLGGAAGNLRGADLRSADAQMQAALRQRQMDDQLRQFYAGQGANLQGARDQATTNREVTRLQSLTRSNQRDANNVINFANQAGTVVAGAATTGKK